MFICERCINNCKYFYHFKKKSQQRLNEFHAKHQSIKCIPETYESEGQDTRKSMKRSKVPESPISRRDLTPKNVD